MKEPKIRFNEFKGEWESAKIGELTSITTGATPSTNVQSYWMGGSIRWMSSGELNDKHIYDVKGRITKEGYNNCGTHLIPPSCVLIGLAGQGKTRGTAAINHVELCTNQSIAAILPNFKLFDSHFLFHFMDDKYLELRSLSSGDGGRGGLNKQILLDFEISLPSIEEQKVLSCYFDCIDAQISASTSRLASLKQIKAASLQAMFPQEGETVPKLRFKGFEGEWNVCVLKDIVNKLTTGKLDANAMVQEGKYRFYTCGKNYFRIDRYAFDDEALLISGNGENVGYVHYYKGKFNAYQRTYVLTHFEVNVFFLKYYLIEKLPFRIKKEKSVANTPYIKMETISEMIVMYPSNEREQKQIGEYFQNLDCQITLQSQRLEKLKQIKAACLDKMFV